MKIPFLVEGGGVQTVVFNILSIKRCQGITEKVPKNRGSCGDEKVEGGERGGEVSGSILPKHVHLR